MATSAETYVYVILKVVDLSSQSAAVALIDGCRGVIEKCILVGVTSCGHRSISICMTIDQGITS